MSTPLITATFDWGTVPQTRETKLVEATVKKYTEMGDYYRSEKIGNRSVGYVINPRLAPPVRITTP